MAVKVDGNGELFPAMSPVLDQESAARAERTAGTIESARPGRGFRCAPSGLRSVGLPQKESGLLRRKGASQ